MKIRLLAFASAAQILGGGELEIELPEGSDLTALRRLLDRRYPELGPLWPRLAVAVDSELVGGDVVLREGVEVALLPPVSGGNEPTRAALTEEPIDLEEVQERVTAPGCGAVVLFVGTVRNRHRGRTVGGIHYHGYRSMAERAMERIATELEAGSEGLRLAIVHRLGELTVGEASVAIAASSPHRAEAYEASRRALERLKREVPIWKQERYEDGEVVWREEESLEVSRP